MGGHPRLGRKRCEQERRNNAEVRRPAPRLNSITNLLCDGPGCEFGWIPVEASDGLRSNLH